MNIRKRSISSNELSTQWTQLAALSFVHFVVDLFAGMMHAVLPQIQDSFGFSIAMGGVLLTVFLITCNGIQLVLGSFREDKDKPVFLYIGLVLTAVISLIAVLPKESNSFFLLIMVTILCGCGIGMTHPEGLRAIHGLNRINSATITSVFMTGGVTGFAVGGWGSAWLVERMGFNSIFILAGFCFAAIVPLLFLNIKLARDGDDYTDNKQTETTELLSFWPFMVMATLAAISSSVLVWILPQKINSMGMGLTFGGVSVMTFSIAGGVGSLFWAWLSGRVNRILCIMLATLAGIPLFLLHSTFVEHKAALLFLFVASFCSFGAYPLTVTAARHSKGPKLGMRMALIVGGIWLISSLFPMLLGPVAQKFGPSLILILAPVGYLFSGIAGVYIFIKTRKRCSSAGQMP